MVVAPTEATNVAVVGTVQPQFKTDFGFRMLGRLIARPVNVGETVAKGQALAAVDPFAAELAVRSALAQLSTAQGQLANASGIAERQRILIETGATTKATLDSAEQSNAAAQSAVVQRSVQPDQGARAIRLHQGQRRLRWRRHRGRRRSRAGRGTRPDRRHGGAARHSRGRDRRGRRPGERTADRHAAGGDAATRPADPRRRQGARDRPAVRRGRRAAAASASPSTRRRKASGSAPPSQP